MQRLRASLVFLVLTCAALGARAHHSFTALFDPSTTVEIAGAVAEFQFIAPHSYIRVEVTDANGLAALWELETTSPGQLIRAGLTPETLIIGTRIAATGNPARDGRRLMRLLTITLPDGEKKRIQ